MAIVSDINTATLNGYPNVFFPQLSLGCVIKTPLTINTSYVNLTSNNYAMPRGIPTGSTPVPGTQLIWGGGNSATPFYMVTFVGPTGASALETFNNGIQGLTLNCNGATGCGGLLDQSQQNDVFRLGVWEPRPAPFTVSGSNSSGTTTLNLTSTTGLAAGMSIGDACAITSMTWDSGNGGEIAVVLAGTGACSAVTGTSQTVYIFGAHNGNVGTLTDSLVNGQFQTVAFTDANHFSVGQTNTAVSGILTGGAYVSNFVPGTQIDHVVSSTQVVLSMNTQMPFAGGETVELGGEGVRFDVTGPYLNQNNNDNIILNVAVRNTGAAPQNPAVVLGGSNVTNQGGSGGTGYGNTNNFIIENIGCAAPYPLGAPCFVLANSDHNIADSIVGSGVITCGMSGSINGGGRYLQVQEWWGNHTSFIYLPGSETGCQTFSVGRGGINFQIANITSNNGLADPLFGQNIYGLRWQGDLDRVPRCSEAQSAFTNFDNAYIGGGANLGPICSRHFTIDALTTSQLVASTSETMEGYGAITVSSAAVNSGGTGYSASASGTMTWAGSGCAINPVLNVTTSGGGVINAVGSVATIGSCSILPSATATTWTPSGLGAGSGADFTLTPGISGSPLVFTPTINGSVDLEIYAEGTVSTNTGGLVARAYYGTGTPPAPGALQSNGCGGSHCGSPCGAAVGITPLVANVIQALRPMSCDLNLGVQLNQQVWVDIAVWNTDGTTTVRATDVSLKFREAL